MDSVRELLETAAKKYGDKPFVLFKDQQASFKKVSDRANMVANAFLSEGIQKGDRVAIMLLNRPEFLYIWFGLNKIGASMVPINTELTAYETEYLLNHSESKMVITDAAHYEIVQKARETTPTVKKTLLLDSNNAPSDGDLFENFYKDKSTELKDTKIDINDEAAILYTSGTTGKPKGCIVDQFYYLNVGDLYIDAFELTSADTILTPLPLFHMNAQTMSTMGALKCGAGLVLIDRFHPANWWKDIREKNVTLFHYLGVIPAMLIGLPDSEYDYSETKITGVGAGVPKDIHAPFEKRFNVELREVYGSTESGGGGCFMIAKKLKDRKVGSATFGMPLGEAKIVDDEDNEVPHCEVGEMVIRSKDQENPRKGFMKGYLKDPDATNQAWKNGWFHTGDFCYRDEGGYYYFVDRKKDMVRRSGENISASEVEEVIRLHPKVLDVAVIAVPDKKRVEEVKAYIIKQDDAELKPEEIIEWCEERSAYFKIPRYIEFRLDFPRTATQKVQKNVLKQEQENLTEGAWDRTQHMKLKREKNKSK